MVLPRSIPRPMVRANQWFIVICVLCAWLSGHGWFLALPLAAGLLGIFFKFNPVMQVTKFFLKKHPSEYVSEDPEQQRFNSIIAVICLALGWIGYIVHWWLIAYIFTALVFLAAFIAILGFCVGCFIRYQWKQYRYRRVSKHSS